MIPPCFCGQPAVAKLREMWLSNEISTAEMARCLGTTKNAVVGKARRIGLPSKPSPIIRTPEGQTPRRSVPKRAGAVTLAPIASVPPMRVATPEIHVAAPAPRTPAFRALPCCWPFGEPGTKTFRFCGEGALEGKPYCGEHCSVAYVRTPVGQEVHA